MRITDPRITNPTNAWVRIEHGAHVLQIDPWISQGGNDGTWHHSVPLINAEQHLEGTTHVALSHLHGDHFDLPTLLSLPKSVQYVIPDIGPNREVMAAPLLKDGRTVHLVKPFEWLDLGPFAFSVIPPMDGHSANYSIDAGILVGAGDWRGLFMADNVPRKLEALNEAQWKAIRGVDLLALSYNGLASDYPLCYGLSDVEVGDITKLREEERFRVNCRFIRSVQPKELMLYSSDMAIAGPMHGKFTRWANWCWWSDYESAHRRYRDELFVSTWGWRLHDEYDWDAYHSRDLRRDPLPGLFPATTVEELADLSFRAFSGEAREYWPGTWALELNATDFGWSAISGVRRNKLTCYAPSNYLAALLRGDTHWNTARISFNLRWKREPNVYCPELYDALNHLHIPRKAGEEAA